MHASLAEEEAGRLPTPIACALAKQAPGFMLSLMQLEWSAGGDVLDTEQPRRK